MHESVAQCMTLRGAYVVCMSQCMTVRVNVSITSFKCTLCDLSLFGLCDIPLTSINITMTPNVSQTMKNSSLSGQDSVQANKCFYSMTILINLK